MKYQVKQKQHNSKMCFVCGLKNAFGLKAAFYEIENDELVALFTPSEEHQGYPGRLHGGIAATILDETIGRAIMAKYPDDYWGVTVEFSAKYKQPIPLNGQLRVVTRITRDANRIFEGTGEILLTDGSVAVEGRGKYLKMPLGKIAEINSEHLEWRVVPKEDDPAEIEI